MSAASDKHWLLVAVTTAGAPAALRVTAWRKLKALGALYLQQSVCLLPDLPETRSQTTALAKRLRRDGGGMQLLSVTIRDKDQRSELRATLQAARDGEYTEVVERFPAYFAELQMETARGRTTFEELEESETDLARFRSWITKIEARDYFKAPLGDRARGELRRAEEALNVFGAAALACSDVPTDHPDRGLRSV